jgi:hypothetical protein
VGIAGITIAQQAILVVIAAGRCRAFQRSAEPVAVRVVGVLLNQDTVAPNLDQATGDIIGVAIAGCCARDGFLFYDNPPQRVVVIGLLVDR